MSQLVRIQYARKGKSSTDLCSEFFELQSITQRYRSICITSGVSQGFHLVSMSFLIFRNGMTFINCSKLTFADGIKIFLNVIAKNMQTCYIISKRSLSVIH